MTNKLKILVGAVFAICSLTACDREAANEAETIVDDGRVELKENQNLEDFGDYVVLVNAQTTDQLEPEVAQEYGIPRSQNRGMLNVVILKKDPQSTLATGQPMRGAVTSLTRNLTGQVKEMELKEVVETDAIYYLGHVPIETGETLVFDIDATPEGANTTLSIRFKHSFYAE